MPDDFHRPNEPHLIWSGEHHAWYRDGAHGYADDIAYAGVFRGRGVNEEKRERRVYITEAIADIIFRRSQLKAQLDQLDDIETRLRLFHVESP